MDEARGICLRVRAVTTVGHWTQSASSRSATAGLGITAIPGPPSCDSIEERPVKQICTVSTHPERPCSAPDIDECIRPRRVSDGHANEECVRMMLQG